MSIPIIERLQSHFNEEVECDEGYMCVDDHFLFFFETSERELHVVEDYVMESFLSRCSPEIESLFFEQFDNVARSQQKDIICIKSSSFFTENLLTSLGFYRVDELSSSYWIKERVPGYVDTASSIITPIQTFFDSLAAQDPTFVLEKNTVRYPLFLRNFPFYYKGTEGILSMKCEEEVWSLDVDVFRHSVSQFPTLTIQDVNTISTYLKAAFDKIHRQQRLENVFSPPKHHFTNILENKLYMPRSNQQVMYDFFLSHMDGEEIEIMFATIKQSDLHTLRSDCDTVTLYQICKWQFVFVDVWDTNSFNPFSDPVAASRFYSDACRQSFEKRLEDQIQLLLKSSN